MKFYMGDEDSILSGKLTDIYFVRTRKIIEAKGLSDIRVRMEVHTGSLPRGFEWAVYAGVEEALKLLEGRPINVWSLPEGTFVLPNFPLMILEGRYVDIALLETPLLGILRHYTSVATRAARIKKLAGGKTVLYFGLRGAHPAIFPMLDRAAYIGGVDGVSGAFNEETIGVKPKGTMPHALIRVFGDEVEAWKAFDEVVEEEVPRIALVDTFNDERFAAMKAVEALGERLAGVRLDTPRSRRGDIKEIIKEIKWTLKLSGVDGVQVLVSGGLGEGEIARLRDVADGFGVGTSITYPKPIDMSMDIVEKEVKGVWTPYTKKGKYPGAKAVFRCGVLDYEVVRLGQTPTRCTEELMIKWIENGKLRREIPSAQEIREYVLKQLSLVEAPEPV
ncbi:MAG: nicotinate phosphoribosyltransferase [Desulfurococcales archaeon]|nr:nicotinate phosphoribosyltransferase [Desulfurococcales archaeon]